jgi:hypothetical protein
MMSIALNADRRTGVAAGQSHPISRLFRRAAPTSGDWDLPFSLSLSVPFCRAFALLACLLMLPACGREIGRPIDVDAADWLARGQSTYQDAVTRFGSAQRVKGQGDRIVAHWHYLKDTAGATKYDSLKILFDAKGRMVRVVERLDSDDEE